MTRPVFVNGPHPQAGLLSAPVGSPEIWIPRPSSPPRGPFPPTFTQFLVPASPLYEFLFLSYYVAKTVQSFRIPPYPLDGLQS